MKIYMAGPLFTVAERRWNKELALELRRLEHNVFLPQESESSKLEDFDSAKIFAEDIVGIEWCDVVLGWVEGPDPDSGTCWELGYAKGKGRKTIAYTTDLRFQDADNGRYDLNLMIIEGANEVLRFESDVTPINVAREVHGVLERYKKVRKLGNL